MYLQLKSGPAFSKSSIENDKTNNTRAFYIKIHPLRELKVEASTVLNLKPCYGNVDDTYSGQKSSSQLKTTSLFIHPDLHVYVIFFCGKQYGSVINK